MSNSTFAFDAQGEESIVSSGSQLRPLSAINAMRQYQLLWVREERPERSLLDHLHIRRHRHNVAPCGVHSIRKDTRTAHPAAALDGRPTYVARAPVFVGEDASFDTSPINQE